MKKQVAKKNDMHILTNRVKKELRKADGAQRDADNKAKSALKMYARDLISRGSKGVCFGLSVHYPPDRWPIIVVHESCLMSNEQVKTVTKSSLSEKGMGLHLCNPRAMGIPDHQSYEIRLGNIFGPIILILVRNVFSVDLAQSGSDSFEQVHNERTEKYGGWIRGCEAEVRPRSVDIIAQMKSPALLKKAVFLRKNMKMICSVGPQKPSTQSKIKYKSAKSGRTIIQPLGNYLDAK